MASILERVRGMIRGDVSPPPVAKLVGFRVLEVEPGRTVFAMEAGPQHANPMGTLHGGILCDLADAAMGIAYASTLSDEESFTTLELKINFFKPVWTSRLTATARVVKRGKTVGMAECDILDEAGSLVARASSTCMTLAEKMAEGR